MDEEDDEITIQITDYFSTKHRNEILAILTSTETSTYYSISVDLFDLILEITELSNRFFIDSAFYIKLFQKCKIKAIDRLFKEDETEQLKKKPNVTLRFFNLPGDQEDVEIQLPRTIHANKFISYNGTVTKVFQKRCIEKQQKFECVKCGTITEVDIDYGHVDLMVKPTKCGKEDCKSDRFKMIETTSENFKTSFKEYQEIKVQEKLDILSVGTLPKSIIIILDDDLVDFCKPGDDVTINGLVIQRWGRSEINMRCDINIVMHANYIKINNQQQNQIVLTSEKLKNFQDFWNLYANQPLKARNILLKSICPKLYGMFIVRLAVSLVLTGGVSRRDQTSGNRIRGDSHLLLVGDPGTGKSQLLKYASKILPHGINTTGMGSTSAGLTATASREGGHWHLEPGALVLADGGICCIDEFNCMRNEDKNSMLEAMEQQTISVAKAGLVCNLKTQCCVFAACNPKGKYNSNEPLTINLGIPSPLLSRFDVVLLLLDTPNNKWDNEAAAFLLGDLEFTSRLNIEINPDEIWEFEKLRVYINYVRSFKPILTEEANKIIQRYYVFQRSMPDPNKARTTARMLESLIRLSQAHAKLMYRKEVLVMDVIVAITLLESSLDQSNSLNILHTSFSNTPEIEYSNQAKIILSKLDLKEFIKPEFDRFNIPLNSFDTNSRNEYYSTSQAEVDNSTSYSQYTSQNEVNKTQYVSQKKTVDEHISQFIDNIPEEKPTTSTTTNKNTQIASQKLSYSNKRKLIEEMALNFSSQTKKAKPDLNQNLTEITNSQFSTQIKSSSTQRTQSKKKDDYEVTEEDLDF